MTLARDLLGNPVPAEAMRLPAAAGDEAEAAYEYRFGEIELRPGVDDATGTVTSLSSRDGNFRTPEGVHPGQLLSDAVEVEGADLFSDTDSFSLVLLPSGWRALALGSPGADEGLPLSLRRGIRVNAVAFTSTSKR